MVNQTEMFKNRYLEWKKRVSNGVSELTEANSKLALAYLTDMEYGRNVSIESVRGPRSYRRLWDLVGKMKFFSKKFKEVYNIDDLTKVNEDQVITLFSMMRTQEIKKINGESYCSTGTFVKAFKSFWHWHQKVSRKAGIEVRDITIDLDSRDKKPRWVYLTEDQINLLYESSPFKYKVIIRFLMDTGLRAPSEFQGIKVSDLYDDFKELNVRDEVSKTFGRKIKLILSSDLIKTWISQNNLKQDDFVFNFNYASINKQLQRLAKRLFGDKESLAGGKYSELTCYDFRHNSCCYWLPRYKSESSLMYRFGWKKSERIHYYSELLGMRDTITAEDTLLSQDKTEIEKNLEKTKRENQLLQEEMNTMKDQMKEIYNLVNLLREKQVGLYSN